MSKSKGGSMDTLIISNDDYVRVFEKCIYRHGWICTLQVPIKDWEDKKYNKYRE